MDEAFWSNVVKRWSEASETVIILKKELAKVQGECELYRDVVQNLRGKNLGVNEASRFRASAGVHARQESGRTIVVDEDHASTLRDELKDAEIGLGRAKDEYRRLQKELAEATVKIRAVTAENTRLLSNQAQESIAAHERNQMQKELNDIRSENQKLIDKVHLLEAELTRVQDTGSHEFTPTIPVQPSSVLQRQIGLLQESVQSKEADNEELRLELEATQEVLLKAEERNKTLMNSIMKLQDITRHSTGSLQAVSNNLLVATPRSRNISLRSTRSNILESVQNTRNVTSPVVGRSNVEDITANDSNRGCTPLLYNFLPEAREKALLKLPVVENTKIISENLFDREFLKGVLGPLTERTSDKQGNTEGKVVTSYLCPTLNHHPWCPASPGQHGYIFVGLGKEKESYKTPITRNLFVGLPKTQSKQRRFRYLGKYRVMRVKSLSLEEWNSLTKDSKMMYTKLTKDKTKDPQPLEDILDGYDRGNLNVPCVMLQCLGFDEQLFEALTSQRDV